MVCDWCRKDVEFTEEHKGLEGWISINHLNRTKSNKNVRYLDILWYRKGVAQFKDLDFCSWECFYSFFKNVANKWEDYKK